MTWTLYEGDCLAVLRGMKANPVDLVLTDPPYGSGGRDGSVHLVSRNIQGNRMSTDAFIWQTRQYAQMLNEVTKDNSHCYIFSDWRKHIDVKIAFETVGWELRSLIVWDKGNGMGEYWRSAHEFVLFFTKVQPKKLTHGGCYNVLKFSPVRSANRLHPAEKPVELIEHLITASSNPSEYVLDCFAGSGTTGVAAENLGRNVIMIEKDPKYCQIIRQRMANRQTTIFEEGVTT